MDTTPLSLLERLQKAPCEADWERLHLYYYPIIQMWAKRLNVPHDHTEDLAQEVMMAILKNINQFERRNTGSFRAWISTIARNKWNEWRRRQETLVPIHQISEPEAPDAVEQFWEREFQNQLYNRALAILKADFEPTTWQAAWDVIIHDQPRGIVAAKYGLSQGAVSSACYRILMRLRRDLNGMLEKEPI